MYLSHFGLDQAPFGITPNPIFFYGGNKRGEILDALIYAVTHGEGIIKVTGEVGSGKTMLCRMLESTLPPTVEVIYLVNPTLSREAVIYAIACELGLATSGRRADEVIRLLQNDLIAKHVAGKQVVLLIEEAQAMSLDTLEEIRLFSNLETAHYKLLQIVLFGQPELDVSLNLPRMRQLKERITHSFKVPPLAPTVLTEFLMFRMRAAGYRGPDIFTKGALKLMASVSEGVIRRISILADKSLLAAFADNTHTIQTKHVKAAIEDSEFSSTRRASRVRNLILAGSAGLALIAVTISLLLTGADRNPFATQTQPVSHGPVKPLDNVVPPISPIPNVRPSNPVTSPFPDVRPDSQSSAAISTTSGAKALPLDLAETAAAPAKNQTGSRSIQQVLAESKPWIAAQAREHYSIQLALVGADKAQVSQYLQKVQEDIGLGEIHIYPIRLGQKALLGVLYGSFKTRADAVGMKNKLTQEHGYQPQLRTISGVTADMQRNNSVELWPN